MRFDDESDCPTLEDNKSRADRDFYLYNIFTADNEGGYSMNGWNDGITHAIAYMEENLTEDISINEIADKAHVSSFYFQKFFHVLCGFTVGE